MNTQKAVFLLLVTVVVTLLGIKVIESPLSDATTDPTTQVGTNAVAGAATTGSVVLTNEHWYADTTSLTVTRSAGATVTAGDVTSSCTLGTDRKTVSCTSLTSDASATNLTIAYLAEISDTTVSIVLKIVPFLLILAGIAAALASAFMGGSAAVRGGGMGSIIEGVITIFIGVVLIPVVLSFVAIVNTTYTNAPEYIGVTSVLSLVTISYVLAIIGSALGTFAPQVRGVFNR